MKKTIIPLLSVVLLAGCAKKEVKYNTMPVETQCVQSTVTATGYVQPVDKVDVGTQVSGVIERIFVDFNSQVKKGQLLAELDKSTLAEKVTQGQASLTSALSDQTYAQQNYDRTKQLYDAKAATQAAWEQVVNALSQSATAVANAKANLHQAQVNLSYAEIYSPIDGVVLNRAVDQGQTVAASFNTPTLFTIARDLTKMQVEADVDEADIGQVRVGQKVTFTVDSYPEDVFDGTVNQIRLQPTVTNNVVTYTVIIEAPNPDEKLFPGMTASVTIVTASEEGPAVLSEALHFQPADQPQGHAGGVWVKTRSGMEHRQIKTGLSDGVHVVVEEGLAIGDTVILSVTRANGKIEQGTNLFMPKRPEREKK